SRASLQFPIGCVQHLLREGNYVEWVGARAYVYLAAVLEYLMTEILGLPANKKTHIIPRHLQLAVCNDKKLKKLQGDITITQG
ncbi:unnamed protein product, partial [Staurois parvus]